MPRVLPFIGKVEQHGHTRGHKSSSEYISWKEMRRRCFWPKTAYYQNYGGRGITVCDRWRYSFSAFLSDMGPKPTPKHTIGRIDSNRNYEPENCRWETRAEQNKSRTRQSPEAICKRGHQWIPENIVVNGDRKTCRLCRNLRYQLKKAGKLSSAANPTPQRG